MTDAEDGLPLPQRNWAVLTIALGIVMAVMDGAIANVALPTIARDLHADPSASVWIVNSYQLAITVSLLPLAALGEIAGYRRVYLAGLALFTAASLACALSPTLTLLTLARVVQGLGAASIMSVNTALVRFIYPHRLLGRGVGINALVVAVSAAVGPTLASAILSVANWPFLFAVNLPFGLAALATGGALPLTPRGSHAFDWGGAVLSALMFGLGIAAIDGAGHHAAPALWLGEFAAAALACWLLVRRESGAAAPMLPVDLLRIPVFRLSICASVASFCAQMLGFVALPFYLESGFGFSAVETGLLITPWPIATAFTAPLAGRLMERYPAGLLGGIGLVLFAFGQAVMALLPPHPAMADIVWRMAVGGAGFGLFQSPNNRTLIAAAPRHRAGGASGMLGIGRLLGQTVGAALLAGLLARYPAGGPRIALGLGAAIALLAAGVSLLRLSPAGARDAA